MATTTNRTTANPPAPLDDWSQHLLVTRLRPPRAAVDEVVRPRLLDAIERGTDLKLTLIVTPPGYGKSTLLSRWQHSTERASSWLSLDVADNDAVVFMRYLVASIQSVDPSIGQSTAALLSAASPLPTQNLLRSLLNDVADSTQAFVLIFDDFHVITSSEVRSAVWQLVQEMPVNMAAIISSREDPNFPTLRMSARGELLELGPAELSFTEIEATEFLLERQQLDLSTSELDEIAHWADGWPLALRLISRIMRGRSRAQIRALLESLPEAVPTIDDYLWDEVLSTRSVEHRDFLLHTSILTQFNPELAAAVSGHDTTVELLRNLDRDNLFIIRLDGPGNWYRYHHLFAEVLHRRLKRDVPHETQLELHARAADWYERNGQIDEAARHALLASHWTQAASHLVDICGEFYDKERIGSLRTWLRDLPPEVYEQAPELAFWMAWAEFRSGHRQGANRLISLVGDAAARSDDIGVSLPAMQVKVLQEVIDQQLGLGQENALRLLDMIGDEQTTTRSRALTMLAILQRLGGELSNAEQTLEQARTINGRIGSRGLQELEQNVTADLLLDMGKLKQPAELLRRNISHGDEWNDLAVQSAHLKLGGIYLEWNQLEEAETHRLLGAEIAAKTNTPIYVPPAHALRSSIALVRNDWDEALDEIDRAIASAAATGSFKQVRRFEARKCRIWLASEQLSLAQGWLQRVGNEVLESRRLEDLPSITTAVRILIYEGNSSNAISALEHLGDLARRRQLNRALLEIMVLLAIAAAEDENLAVAQSAIDEALSIGAPEGFSRIFLDEGQRIRPILRLAARNDGPKRDYAVALLAGAGEIMVVDQPFSEEQLSVLSPRERDVMRLVATGLSNRAVGDTLFISEETVKTHLRRIFDKLEVTSRTQAINKLREMKLL